MEQWSQEHAKFIVVSIADEEGHEIVWSPSHHSNSRSIELVWTNIKRRVDHHYTTKTILQDVKQRLDQAFLDLVSKMLLDALERRICICMTHCSTFRPLKISTKTEKIAVEMKRTAIYLNRAITHLIKFIFVITYTKNSFHHSSVK